MRQRPDGVSDVELCAVLADGWGARIDAARFRPVGAGSYHWEVTDDRDSSWFVTVDDLGVEGMRAATLAALTSAMDTALALRRDAGLDFVVAPVPTRTATTVWPLGNRYAVTVFPLLAGVAGEFGPHLPADRAAVVTMLAELHVAAPPVSAMRAELSLPNRRELLDALRELDSPWTGGPFAEPARALLTRHRRGIELMLADFDGLAGQLAGFAAEWVITHGEPHPGNLLSGAGDRYLIDWDTVRLAPPERDLWLAVDTGDGEDTGALAAYTEATGRPVEPAALAYYRLRWRLADIAYYVAQLRGPHRYTADTEASWRYLGHWLS